MSRGRIAGVETAGDVGRRDQRHQLGVERTTFAEIAVEIKLHSCDHNIEVVAIQFSRVSVQTIIATDEHR